MKKPLVFLLPFMLLCAGCGQSRLVQAAPEVHEFFVGVVIKINEAGDYQLDDDGNFDAECRLGSKVATGNSARHPILEARPIKTASYGYGTDIENSCDFDYTLPFDFCALTSVQNNPDCKVSYGSGPGWFVELRFRNPESGYLHCTMACFDFSSN